MTFIAVALIVIVAACTIIGAILTEIAKTSRLRQPLANGQRRALARATADADACHWCPVTEAEGARDHVTREECRCKQWCGVTWCGKPKPQPLYPPGTDTATIPHRQAS